MPIMSSEGWAADVERALPSGLVHRSRIIDHAPIVGDSPELRLWPLFASLCARLWRMNGRRGWRHALRRAPSPRLPDTIRDA
jgi:hypothetical protein